MNIYDTILNRKRDGRKQFAVLIDPDKREEEDIIGICREAEKADVDYVFIGGSLLTNGNLHRCVKVVKATCKLPAILFPGSNLQIDASADAILFLSLISGRNPDLLIGQHVIAAPLIREKNIEAIPTGYMLIESGAMTTVVYMSNTLPIPHTKNDIAACTAMAGEMLGLKMVFMDAGSGAMKPVDTSMINSVAEKISVPLIVGGGIRTAEQAAACCRSGADIIVVGNSIEKDPSLLRNLAGAVKSVTV